MLRNKIRHFHYYFYLINEFYSFLKKKKNKFFVCLHTLMENVLFMSIIKYLDN